MGLERVNAQVDIRHKRRALKPDEFAKLLKSARESKKNVQSYPGPLRAQVYLLSYLPGLRRKELSSLTPRSFELSSDPPVLRVEAACSKHRREDVLPLHPELVELLGVWLDGVEPDPPPFPESRDRGRMAGSNLRRPDSRRVRVPHVVGKRRPLAEVG